MRLTATDKHLHNTNVKDVNMSQSEQAHANVMAFVDQKRSMSH